LLGYGIKLLLGGLLLCVRQPKHPSIRFLFFWLKQRQMIASLQRSERLEAHVKWIAILIATCMIPVPLRPQERSPATKTRANSQASSAVILGERLAREYEK
jgi:hypothetical protein